MIGFANFSRIFSRAPVERPLMLEATAQGAAFLAGLTLGVFADVAAIAAAWVPGGQVRTAHGGSADGTA